MKSSFVVDSFSIPISDQEILETEGFISVPAVIAAPGIQEYMNDDGSVTRVLVPQETLVDPSWLASVAQAPITDEHPKEPVTPDNVKRYSIGNVGDVVEYDTKRGVVVRMILRDRMAIDAVKSRRKVDTSPAYYADYDDTPGVHPEFGAYDRIQIKRRATNHVAHCTQGRGEQARLLLDSVDTPAALAHAWTALFPTKDSRMATPNTTETQQYFAGLREVIALVEELRKDSKDEAAPKDATDIDPEVLASAKESLTGLTGIISQLAAQRDQVTQQLEEMRGELAAVLAEIQGGAAEAPAEPADAGMEVPQDEAPKEEEETVMDSKFLDYYNDRQAILKIASEFALDSVETLTNAQLRKAIVEKHTANLPDDRKLHLDSAVEVRAAYQTIEALRSMPKNTPGKAWEFAADSSKNVNSAADKYRENIRNAKAERIANRQ